MEWVEGREQVREWMKGVHVKRWVSGVCGSIDIVSKVGRLILKLCQRCTGPCPEIPLRLVRDSQWVFISPNCSAARCVRIQGSTQANLETDERG